jgi:Flp pilus assembly protein TadG
MREVNIRIGSVTYTFHIMARRLWPFLWPQVFGRRAPRVNVEVVLSRIAAIMPLTVTDSPNANGQSAVRPRRRAKSRRGAVAVEAAVCLPVIVAMMLGMWEVGRIAQMSRIIKDAAREGARVAAGGSSGGATVTVATVQSAVQNFMTASGMPAAAVSGATITVTNLSADTWTDPGNAIPLDHFRVTVTIPSGAAFNSLQIVTSSLTGVTQLQESVDWLSANDAQVVVNTQLPY